MDIGAREILILAVIILILFGSERIPDLAKGIGKSLRHVRDALKDDASSNKITKR